MRGPRAFPIEGYEVAERRVVQRLGAGKSSDLIVEANGNRPSAALI
jgi:hypothetical protein